jgi:hypothetical protein
MKYFDVSIGKTEHYKIKAKDSNEAILKSKTMSPFCTESYGHNTTERTIDQIVIEEYK